MKTISKKLLIISIITLGFSTNANAQILDFLNGAIETVNKATNTYNNARDTYNNTRETFSNSNNTKPAYEVIGSVTMYYVETFSGHVTAKGSTSANVIEDKYGTKMIKKGGSTYRINRNRSYDPYSSDFPYQYEYWVTMDGRIYYFNM